MTRDDFDFNFEFEDLPESFEFTQQSEGQDEDEVKKKREYVKKVKYREIVTRKADSFLDVVGPELKSGVQYRIVTNNSFNAITVIEYLSRRYTLTDIYIAIYRMNLRSVEFLEEFIENSKVRAVILLSSFFRENKKYERWTERLMSFAEGNPDIEVSYSWNHAKIFLAKSACGKYIVFEGSGNLSDNARIEQYIIEDNRQVYEFHREWIEDIKKAP